MSSRLLDQSLDQMGQTDRRQRPTGGNNSRSSPYNRSERPTSASDGAWKHDMYDSNDVRGGSRGRGPRGAGNVAGPAYGNAKPTGKLYIDNLHYEVSEKELNGLFAQIGPLVKAFIKYDKSGRSTGQAVVIYEEVDDATAAKDEYDGAKAKGQNIRITQETRAERPQGRGGAAQGAGGKDLLSRFDLLSRMGGSESRPPKNAPRGPAAETRSPAGGRQGPQRGVGGTKTSERGVGREKRKPATAADLDAELEAFMKTPSSGKSTADSAHAPPVEDVDMA